VFSTRIPHKIATELKIGIPLNRIVKPLAWALFAATLYLIVANGLKTWVLLPRLGDIGSAIVFVLFALCHCLAYEGGKRTAIFYATSVLVSFLMEEAGVRTGLIYGAYHFSDTLGLKLCHVPIIVPLAWFMMIYPSWMVAKALLRGIDVYSLAGSTALAVVAAFVMIAWDVVMDPVMARAGNWVWENGGSYFGVPRRNYIGWLLTTFLVYWIAGWFWRSADRRHNVSKIFAALPVIVYAAYAVQYLAPGRIPELQVVALFCMVTPAVVALIQTFMKRNEPARIWTKRSSDRPAQLPPTPLS
jgi:uncharacterized membrane protein